MIRKGGHWRGPEAERMLALRLQRNLQRAAIHVRNEAVKIVNVRAGRHRGEAFGRWLTYLGYSIVTEVEGFTARIGTGLKGAALQELGGPVTPTTAGALAIPIHRKARAYDWTPSHRIPAGFPNLRFVPRKGRPPLLVQEKNPGRKPTVGGGWSIRVLGPAMFVLVRSVIIPARPYLRRAMAEQRGRIKAMLMAGMPE